LLRLKGNKEAAIKIGVKNVEIRPFSEWKFAAFPKWNICSANPARCSLLDAILLHFKLFRFLAHQFLWQINVVTANASIKQILLKRLACCC